MNFPSSNPLITLQAVWRRGSRSLKALASLGIILAFIGFIAFSLSSEFIFRKFGEIFIGASILIWFFLDTIIRAEWESKIEARVERAEQAVVQNPEKTGPLWDLARSRLELYFERNLSQIRSIFWITLLVMLAGFAMIGYGIVRASEGDKLQASLNAAASGILTEFIAATFLIIYRSPMNQATDYVRTLERINTVGMSIQIISEISDSNDELKSKVRAELGIKILGTLTKATNAKPDKA